MNQLPYGTYFGRPVQATYGLSSVKKSPQLVITFALTHYADNGAWQPMEPQQQRMYLSMVDGTAAEISEKKLEFLGFNGDFNRPEIGRAHV